jgi:nucleotide-binding universal stress UspA family protein
MYRKILVPLDGSPRAEAILPHVEEMAQLYKAEVILLQVIAPDTMSAAAYHRPPHIELDNLFQQHEDETKAYLAERQNDLHRKGIPSCSFLEYGPVVSTIIDVAEREGVDLIAIASHGRSGLSRALYGSVAAGVLNQVNMPLLLIRAPGQ